MEAEDSQPSLLHEIHHLPYRRFLLAMQIIDLQKTIETQKLELHAAQNNAQELRRLLAITIQQKRDLENQSTDELSKDLYQDNDAKSRQISELKTQLAKHANEITLLNHVNEQLLRENVALRKLHSDDYGEEVTVTIKKLEEDLVLKERELDTLREELKKHGLDMKDLDEEQQKSLASFHLLKGTYDSLLYSDAESVVQELELVVKQKQMEKRDGQSVEQKFNETIPKIDAVEKPKEQPKQQKPTPKDENFCPDVAKLVTIATKSPIKMKRKHSESEIELDAATKTESVIITPFLEYAKEPEPEPAMERVIPVEIPEIKPEEVLIPSVNPENEKAPAKPKLSRKKAGKKDEKKHDKSSDATKSQKTSVEPLEALKKQPKKKEDSKPSTRKQSPKPETETKSETPAKDTKRTRISKEVKDTSRKESPKDSQATQTPSKKESSKKDNTVKESVRKDHSKKEEQKKDKAKTKSMKEVPKKENSVKDKTVKETPMKEAPKVEKPAMDKTVKETPMKEAPKREKPVKETPLKTSRKESPKKEKVVNDTPPKQTERKESPKPVKKTTSKKDILSKRDKAPPEPPLSRKETPRKESPKKPSSKNTPEKKKKSPRKDTPVANEDSSRRRRRTSSVPKDSPRKSPASSERRRHVRKREGAVVSTSRRSRRLKVIEERLAKNSELWARHNLSSVSFDEPIVIPDIEQIESNNSHDVSPDFLSDDLFVEKKKPSPKPDNEPPLRPLPHGLRGRARGSRELLNKI